MRSRSRPYSERPQTRTPETPSKYICAGRPGHVRLVRRLPGRLLAFFAGSQQRAGSRDIRPWSVTLGGATLAAMTEEANVGMTPVSALAGAAARIAPETNLLDVARALMDADIGLLVLSGEGEDVRGVVSERDVVRALATGRDPAVTPVADIATTELVWCDSASTVAEVAEEMMERYIRHVLVEEDGHLVGVISARDLLGAYASADLQMDE